MKKYKVLPKEAIIVFFIILILLIMTAKIIDNYMPQYSDWKRDDDLIENEKREKINSKMFGKEEQTFLYFIDLRRKSLTNEKKKILVIGDSYIAGDGYSNINLTWWRQLELELYSRGFYDVEVSAIGMNGASTYDEMLWLTSTDLVNEINPDLIIFGYVTNDPELEDKYGNTIVRQMKQINYFNNNKELEKISKLFPNITYKINNMINKKIESKVEYNEEIGYPDHIWRNVIINDTWSKVYDEKAIKPLGEYLNNITIPSFVVNTPNYDDLKSEERYKIFSLFENSGIKTYNIFKDFKQTVENIDDKNNKKVNPVNGHPGTLYTKYYAKYISDIIQRDYPEALGEKYKEKIEYPICINYYFPFELDLEVQEEQEDSATYTIKYPSTQNMLTMPIKEEYIKLSLQYPIEIKDVELQGDSLNNAKMYVTSINEKLGYDDQNMFLIGNKKGSDEVFQIEEKKLITSICIHADIPTGKELKIIIKK